MCRSYIKYGFCLLLFLAFLLVVSAPVFGACQQQGSLRVVRLLQQVDQELSANQLVAAQQRLELFKQQYPDDPHYLIDYHLGNLYGQTGQLDKALSAYDAALSHCDQEPSLWQNRGKIAWDLKQYSIAADSLFQAYELAQNKDPSLLFHTAMARSYADQKEGAVKLLETLLGDQAEAVEDIWLETYTNLCIETKQIDRALQRLNGWRPELENRKLFWRLLTILQVQQHDYEKGATSLQVLAAFEPLNKDDKRLLADLLLQIDIPLEAAEQYEELLADNPQEQDLHNRVITSYRRGLQPQKALVAIERALALNRSEALLQQRGEILFEQRQYEQAFRAFEELVQLDANKGVAYLYQGYCALRIDDLMLARKVLTKASAFKRERKEAQRLLAWMDRG
ncbi:Tetratricopeptide repeat-containing protein [Desulfuromusa kysingii]|uniref:Tetratricopeptide repeat-containing protein n=1 Tax=Desulfuromusa kysingii TaxID=37625 RepID=A0A1H3VT38_9BACT|nr:tetratricopeptide repeat protein [Desulfuromusa kysingii]SDZ77936.1 Tetratricopeptide repeat-containing protein [Desulfuromusa kysingii]